MGVSGEGIRERGLKLSWTNTMPFACKAKPYKQRATPALQNWGERSVAWLEPGQPHGNASHTAWLKEGLYLLVEGAGLRETCLARASPSSGTLSSPPQEVVVLVVAPSL